MLSRHPSLLRNHRAKQRMKEIQPHFQLLQQAMELLLHINGKRVVAILQEQLLLNIQFLRLFREMLVIIPLSSRIVPDRQLQVPRFLQQRLFLQLFRLMMNYSVLRELKDQSALRELRAFKEYKVHRERRDYRVFKVFKELRAHLVHRVARAVRVFKVFKEYKERRVFRVLKELRVLWVLLLRLLKYMPQLQRSLQIRLRAESLLVNLH